MHLAVGVPRCCACTGSLAHQVPRPARRGAGSYIGEILTRSQNRDLCPGADLDFSYVPGGRPLPRRRLPQGDRHRGDLPSIPAEVPTLRSWRCPRSSPSCATFTRAWCWSPGFTGTGKSTALAAMIDHLNSDPRAGCRRPRGPDRVRATEQEQPGHPARATAPTACKLRRRRARGDARRSGRDPGRGAARRGDDLHGHDGGGDRAPGARHAAHHRAP